MANRLINLRKPNIYRRNGFWWCASAYGAAHGGMNTPVGAYHAWAVWNG